MDFSYEFQAIQSKYSSYRGNVNVTGLEGKNERGEFFFKHVVLWNRLVFSFMGRALASADFSPCNHLTVNGNVTFERKQKKIGP